MKSTEDRFWHIEHELRCKREELRVPDLTAKERRAIESRIARAERAVERARRGLEAAEKLLRAAEVAARA